MTIAASSDNDPAMVADENFGSVTKPNDYAERLDAAGGQSALALCWATPVLRPRPVSCRDASGEDTAQASTMKVNSSHAVYED